MLSGQAEFLDTNMSYLKMVRDLIQEVLLFYHGPTSLIRISFISQFRNFVGHDLGHRLPSI